MKNILLTLVFVLLLIDGFSQSITKTVVDESTDEILPYASIYWQSSKDGVMTDDEGVFTIELSEEKKDSLVVQYIGYKPKTISSKKLKRLKKIKLSNTDLEIEEIVVTPVDANRVLFLADSLKIQNHFENKTVQSGFARSQFYNKQQIFQISESVYKLYSHLDDKKETKQSIKIQKSRSIIDSTIYKQYNDFFNSKRDTVFIEPKMFLSFGQTGVVTKNDDKLKKKYKKEAQFLRMTTYQGREAYEVIRETYLKGTKIGQGRFIIDADTYAYLLYDYSTENEEELNKAIPFMIRSLIKLLGYEIQFTKINGTFYFKHNQKTNKFDLDKGISRLGLNVKRKGVWMNGSVQQEYSLTPPKSFDGNQLKDQRGVVVSQFDSEFFEGYYHVPVSSQIEKKIEMINDRNASFAGNSIASERAIRYGKKKAKKKKRKNRRK